MMVEIKHRAAWYVSLSVSTDTVWLRSEPKFCEFVKDILFAYSQYNRECGHVTGLADVLTSIVHVFVDGKIDESVTMTDGRTMNRDEALSFVFWNFVGFIERNKRDQIFTYPLEAQHFSSERVFTIIKEVDPVLASWMELHDLTDLSFLYKKVVLSFQRDLESESLLKLWDAIAAAPERDQLLRFFSASFIISLFLPCLEKDVGNPSDFVDVMDDVSKSSNIADLLEMTVNLIRFVKSKPALEWIFMVIPGNEKFQDFTPTMLTIH